MEVRSSRRMRTLVTQWSNRGLSGNENARALISMMARSKCSNQRPDTLMRDRSPPARRNHLQRTAGPYSWVKNGRDALEMGCLFYARKQTLAELHGTLIFINAEAALLGRLKTACRP